MLSKNVFSYHLGTNNLLPLLIRCHVTMETWVPVDRLWGGMANWWQDYCGVSQTSRPVFPTEGAAWLWCPLPSLNTSNAQNINTSAAHSFKSEQIPGKSEPWSPDSNVGCFSFTQFGLQSRTVATIWRVHTGPVPQQSLTVIIP